LQIPRTEDEWKQVANDYEQLWNFPHCVGAMDGKHIAIVPPPNAGSLYFNYKHFNSIVLLALVDAKYRFLYVDVGCFGRISDGGVFSNSNLFAALENNSLNIPPPSSITNSNIVTPYTIVADDAFPLKKYLLKPYSQQNLIPKQRIFNYRLSRARRVSENVFGHIVQRFRILRQPIQLEPEKVEIITMAICCLHNFLLRDVKSQTAYLDDIVEQMNPLQALAQQGSNHSSAGAQEVRDVLCNYFSSEQGAVSWQDERAFVN
jgi:hypothetical protein